MRGVGPNKVCWKLARSRGFEVSSFYLSFYPPSLFFFWISKKKILLKKEWQEKYKEFTVVNKE